jgi:hypothetical protein
MLIRTSKLRERIFLAVLCDFASSSKGLLRRDEVQSLNKDTG